jgi:hypothetical protein
LPSIGHRQSHGGIRRVSIVEPPCATETDAEALDLLRVKLQGSILTDAKKGPALWEMPRGSMAVSKEIEPAFLSTTMLFCLVKEPAGLLTHRLERRKIAFSGLGAGEPKSV